MTTKKIFILTIFCQFSLLGVSQGEIASPLKRAHQGNPLLPFMYTADPTAVEFGDRLYVYATNDTEEFLARGKEGGNTYSAIGTLAVMSSDDLVNWQFHGLIPAKELSAPWAGNSWAPSIVSRIEEDGQTHFYLYFSNGGGGIGVLTATSPTGPWKAPIPHALVDYGTVGVAPCAAPMDPGVVIDDKGVGWLAFGGGMGPNAEGTEMIPGNARIVKLKSNLIELDGGAQEIKAPYHFEANELNFIEGKWVYSYCSTWTDRKNWTEYGSKLNAMGLCSMCYMVSDNPLDTDSWTYKGEYFANPYTFGYLGGNNHSHLHKFKNNWYFLYHTQWLESVSDYPTGGFRCVAINNAKVIEKAQRVNTVTADDTGVPALKNLDPYIVQQAETTAATAGLSYENFFNAGFPDRKLSHENLVIGNIPSGAWTMVRNVDFGSKGAKSFTAKLKGSGRLCIFLDDIYSSPAAILDFATAGMKDFVIDDLDDKIFNGVHDVYFCFFNTRIAQFDEWNFVQHLPDGIPTLTSENIEEIYSISGQRIKDARKNDIVIIRKRNGETRKIIKH